MNAFDDRPKRDGERETKNLSERKLKKKNKKRREEKKNTQEIIANTIFFFLPLEIGQNSLNTSETVCCKQFAAQISNDLGACLSDFRVQVYCFICSQAVVCQLRLRFLFTGAFSA